jgi:tol-pal system protein YbgF
MTSKKASVVVLAAVLLAGARPATAAANKEHQQIMAELRMLQEQQAQVLQAIAGLNETLKLITTRIDDQSATQRKASADQKLILDNIAEAARILRERADDTNVRLSNVSQELQSLRQTVATIPQNTAAVPTGTGEATATGDPAGQPGSVVIPPNVSPGQFYQRVTGDYAAGQYDLAISGFEAFIRSFPTSPQADDAQLLIGNSWYNQGNFANAVTAYQKVITDFPQSEQVPPALYKMGQSYENLKRDDEARKVYERVVKEFPASVENSLSRQRLDAIARKRQ